MPAGSELPPVPSTESNSLHKPTTLHQGGHSPENQVPLPLNCVYCGILGCIIMFQQRTRQANLETNFPGANMSRIYTYVLRTVGSPSVHTFIQLSTRGPIPGAQSGSRTSSWNHPILERREVLPERPRATPYKLDPRDPEVRGEEYWMWYELLHMIQAQQRPLGC